MSKLIFKIAMLVLATCGVTTSAKAQGSQDCKADLKQILEMLSKPVDGSSGKTMIELTLLTVPRDSATVSKSRQSISIATGGGKMRYRSEQMNVFADADLSICEIPSQKVLYLSPGTSARSKNQVSGNMALLESNVLEGASILQCKHLAGTKMLVEIGQGTGKLADYGITKIRYVYDAASKKLLEVRASHVPKSEIAYTLIIYEQVDMDYRGEILDQSVRSMVYETGSKVSKRYIGYNIVKTNEKL